MYLNCGVHVDSLVISPACMPYSLRGVNLIIDDFPQQRCLIFLEYNMILLSPPPNALSFLENWSLNMVS